MDTNLDSYSLKEDNDNTNDLKRKTNKAQGTGNRASKRNQTSPKASHLGTHLKTQTGEKANKCCQCDYASSEAGHFSTHLNKHTGEKSHKCNQCDFASSWAAILAHI